MNMDQLEKMFQLFQQMQKTNQNTEPSTPELKVAKKLNYQNYTKWCRLMHIAIERKTRLYHITAAPPQPTNPTYSQWKQRDTIVLSWIISNIETDLINQFLDYTTSWDLWKG